MKPEEQKKALLKLLDLQEEFDAFEVILVLASSLDWTVAVPLDGEEEGDVAGLAMGSKEFLNQSLYDPEDFEYWDRETDD